jgi:hypothetical protein
MSKISKKEWYSFGERLSDAPKVVCPIRQMDREAEASLHFVLQYYRKEK